MKGPEYADVLSAHEIREKVRTPHEVCRDVTVSHQAPVRDENRIAGTAIGAVLGGVLGHQIGGGTGKTLATVAGAAGGGYAGNQIQENMQQSDREISRQTRCKTVYETHSKSVGYDVTYQLGDKQGVVRMDYDPGRRIPVEDGQLVLTPPRGNSPG
jgi:uncharacterized protein YcfJ